MFYSNIIEGKYVLSISKEWENIENKISVTKTVTKKDG